jgi:hypothetical protein
MDAARATNPSGTAGRTTWKPRGVEGRRVHFVDRLEPVVEALSRLSAPAPSWLARVAAELAKPNSLTGARQNVHHHDDLGNAFYGQWLDSELVSTCAYFTDPEMPLEQAQRAKVDILGSPSFARHMGLDRWFLRTSPSRT